MKTVVITQSSYIPWRGFFDMIRITDEVILLDCVQYTRRDWRNRNKIKTPDGPTWLTIPVRVKGRYFQAIDETEIADPSWIERHLNLIKQNYTSAECYDEVMLWFEAQLRSLSEEPKLSVINEHLLRAVSNTLSLKNTFRQSIDLIERQKLRSMGPTERLVALCEATDAMCYITGPTARSYLNMSRFADAGVEVIWMNCDGYSDYPQLWGAFTQHLSIIDLLFNVGQNTLEYFARVSSIETADGAD